MYEKGVTTNVTNILGNAHFESHCFDAVVILLQEMQKMSFFCNCGVVVNMEQKALYGD